MEILRYDVILLYRKYAHKSAIDELLENHATLDLILRMAKHHLKNAEKEPFKRSVTLKDVTILPVGTGALDGPKMHNCSAEDKYLTPTNLQQNLSGFTIS